MSSVLFCASPLPFTSLVRGKAAMAVRSLRRVHSGLLVMSDQVTNFGPKNLSENSNQLTRTQPGVKTPQISTIQFYTFGRLQGEEGFKGAWRGLKGAWSPSEGERGFEGLASRGWLESKWKRSFKLIAFEIEVTCAKAKWAGRICETNGTSSRAILSSISGWDHYRTSAKSPNTPYARLGGWHKCSFAHTEVLGPSHIYRVVVCLQRHRAVREQEKQKDRPMA